MKPINLIGVLSFLFLFFNIEQGFATDFSTENWRLNEIRKLENGFLEKTAGDPFIVFPEIEQSTCSPKGIQLSITFDPVPIKPVLMELFWSTDFLGFGEENKVFFIVFPHKNRKKNSFIVPLDHTAGFTQVRLDFPSHIDTSFKVEDYEIVSLNDPPENIDVIDAYYSLSIKDSLKPAILFPYLLKTLKHGPQRLSHDKGFLLFWLILIGSLLYTIRLSARKILPRE